MVKRNNKETTPEVTEATDKVDEATAALLDAAETSKKGYFVKEGKSVTSRKGVKGPGDRVEPEIFGKIGATVLDDLCRRGIVEYRK